MKPDKSFYAQHQDLLKESIMEGQSKFPKLRLFPAQVGSFYVKRFIDKKTYKFEGPYKIGTVGQADVNGWVTLTLKDLNKIFKPEDEVAIRVEVEVKSGKKLIDAKSEQGTWQRVCKKMGVIHIVATNKNSIVENLTKYFKKEN